MADEKPGVSLDASDEETLEHDRNLSTYFDEQTYHIDLNDGENASAHTQEIIRDFERAQEADVADADGKFKIADTNHPGAVSSQVVYGHHRMTALDQFNQPDQDLFLLELLAAADRLQELNAQPDLEQDIIAGTISPGGADDVEMELSAESTEPEIPPSSPLPQAEEDQDSEYKVESSDGEEDDAQDEQSDGKAQSDTSDQSIAGPSARADTYTSAFSTFQAAQDFLSPPRVRETYQKLNISGDDWQTVKGQDLHEYCASLFNVLGKPGDAPPEAFLPFAKDYFKSHQQTVHASINALLQANPLKVEARVMLMMKEIIKVHEEGAPKESFIRKGKSHKYKIEAHLKCSERVVAVIFAAEGDKYVANDIISGVGLEDLARTPKQYLRRKIENTRVNAKKAHDRDSKRKGHSEPEAGAEPEQEPNASSGEENITVGPKGVKEETQASEERDDGEGKEQRPANPTFTRALEKISRMGQPVEKTVPRPRRNKRSRPVVSSSPDLDEPEEPLSDGDGEAEEDINMKEEYESEKAVSEDDGSVVEALTKEVSKIAATREADAAKDVLDDVEMAGNDTEEEESGDLTKDNDSDSDYTDKPRTRKGPPKKRRKMA